MNNARFSKNDKQIYFNQLKGTIVELKMGENFCTLVLKVGHDNTRHAAFIVKKSDYNAVLSGQYSDGDKVCVKYFISSKNKNGNWYTTANFLDINKEN